MKKTYSYKECYQILRSSPNSSWADLRKTYKKSIQKWHPDRFDDVSKEKLAAEHKIKEINHAYNQIQKYYKANNTLPPIEQSPARKVETTETQNESAVPEKKQEAVIKPTATNKQYTKKPEKNSKRSLVAGIITLSILGSSYYFFADDFYLNEAKSLNNKPNQQISAVNTPLNTKQEQKNYLEDNLSLKAEDDEKTSEKKKQIKAPVLEHYFTNGSSISDVIGVQGAPTRTDGDIWYYGKSEVHFSEGVVVHWVRGANTPLKARMVFGNTGSK